MKILIPIATILLLCSACAESISPTSNALSAEQEQALADELTERIEQYSGTHNLMKCDDAASFEPWRNYFTESVLNAADSTVKQWEGEEFIDIARGGACGRESIELLGQKNMIRILSANSAVIASTFDEIVTDTSGVKQRVKGSWMSVWVKTDNSWKITAWTDDHLDVDLDS